MFVLFSRLRSIGWLAMCEIPFEATSFMKRFRFRLDRIEKWRRQLVAERHREHEIATAALTEAEEALLDHDAFTREYLEELSRRRRSGAAAIEMLVESERMRQSLATRRAGLETRYRETRSALERSLEKLIAARRDLKALESLRAARQAEWRREAENEEQKQADEAHRARLLRERHDQARADTSAVDRDPREMSGTIQGEREGRTEKER